MGELTIHESGMIFGPFADSCVFQLEKSALYKGEFRQESIKTCEFVLQKDNKIYFIEAKESCPNYHNASSSDEKRKKYNEYIQDISQKMRDSLNMYMSILLGCNDSSELPRDMHLSDLSEYAIRFVLVVKNAEKSWLEPYPAIFQEKLRNEMRIWGIPSFIVWTEERARSRGLLSNSQQGDSPTVT